MFENIAAIDIGTSSVKLVTVKTGMRDFQVTDFVYEDIDFRIENPEEAVRDALSRIFKDRNLKGFTLCANLPMEKAIIRNISFPFNDIEKIAGAIPFEAEANIPFKLEDLAMDFQSLKSPKPDEGRILLAATHRETIAGFLDMLGDFDVIPSRLGLESNALFECYRYFNKIEKESVMQIDIGHNKTIINFISDSNLLFTRSIPIGAGLIYQSAATTTKLPYHEAVHLFQRLHLDLSSLENNLQRDFHRTLDLNRAKLKKIFDDTHEILRELIEQLYLTIKSFSLSYAQMEFSRVLLSGGGSNIIGIGQIIGSALELPIVSLPFLEGYDDIRIHTQFPIAFGTVLSALNRRQSAINLLKGEFLPDIVSKSKKIYYLAAAFLILAALVLGVNLLLSAVMESRMNSRYEDLLQERFRRYFHSRPTGDDPIRQATKIIGDERKELSAIKAVLQSDVRILEILKDMLAGFPKDPSFELKNMVINEKIVRIDGETANSAILDEFKNRLQQSKQYESVVLNTNMRSRSQVGFTMTVKLSISDSRTAPEAASR